MAQGLISENDIQRAIDRLGDVVPETICRQFFTRERLLRLERMVDQRIAHPFLIDLIVRQQGPSLLAERQRRFGNKNTSIRRLLLQSLDEDDLRALFERVRRKPPPASRSTIERDLADFKWHRGSSSALAITRAVGLPDAFAGMRAKRERANDYEIDTIGELKPLKAFQRGVLREVRTILDRSARAMVSSFTGTGKTRIGMEYVVDTITTSVEPALVLWVAQKGELLDQACELGWAR